MRCECFSLCGKEAATSFRARLPRHVNDSSSPWVRYLQSIYGHAISLPFDVSQLELFWAHLLPTGMHLCPKPHLEPEQPVLPLCPAADCKGWLEPQARLIPDAPATYIWPPLWPWMLPADAVGRARQRARHTQFLLIQPHERSGFLNGSWVEVVRVTPPSVAPGSSAAECDTQYGWQRTCQSWSPRSVVPFQPAAYMQRPECLPLGCCREGREYGCWLWPARGSGIFVHIGRTLIFHSRPHAEESGFGVKARVYNRKHGFNVTVRLRGNDCMYARVARERHLDSLQILHANRNIFTGQKTEPASELVLTAPGCVHTNRLLTHACPPVELRAGLAAAYPCTCSADQADTVLNCLGGSGGLAAWQQAPRRGSGLPAEGTAHRRRGSVPVQSPRWRS